MPTKGKNIVKYNAGEQSLKVANVIYFDLETLQRKQQSAQNNPIQSYTETKTIQEAGGYSLALETTYDKRTHKFYRGKDCMEQFGNDLMILAIKVINTDKKEMTPRTNGQEKYNDSCEYCHICRKKFCSDENDKEYRKYCKGRDHDHYTAEFRGAAQSICNIRYNTAREIPVISHNGTNYDCHLIIIRISKKV